MWLPYLEYYLRPVPGFTVFHPLLEAASLRAWRRDGRPPAPRTVKEAIIRGFAGPPRRVFVETGTFYGDMIAAVRGDFERLFSIELSPRLARRATRRFAGDPRVAILEGDSGDRLGPLLRGLGAPAVIWLDGHYSGVLTARGESDTPLARELAAALECGTTQDVVLVDDARLIGCDPAYPSLGEIESLVGARRPGWTVQVLDDVLRVQPR